MADVSKLKSHPDKLLFCHINGVIDKVKKLTQGLAVTKLAELAAIFHDLGKINPNFQDKINKKKTTKYSHHAYLSAYAFFVFCSDKSNVELVKTFLSDKNYRMEAIAATIIIAKHHGHLPDFCPKSDLETDPYILNKNEIKNLYSFLEQETNHLPVNEFISDSFKHDKKSEEYNAIFNDLTVKKFFLDKLYFNSKDIKDYLDFFLNTQFSFAALIQADKSDAMGSSIIDEDKFKIREFCKIYPSTLEQYTSKFTQDSSLNKLRTQIRKECTNSIKALLSKGERVFELTAPTGSGKTIILLSLASEIIQSRCDLRIIYALPFLSITEQVENEVLEIFKEFKEENFIQRIDTKSSNHQFEKIQSLLDADTSPEKIQELDFLAFMERIFAYPFVITTFVRFFETLLSNHNATLLKLPNFSKSIFLLDEIQSLPPRLYTFLVAFLSKFCNKFDCYAIVSTATQPNFDLPDDKRIRDFFYSYERPSSLLKHEKYFENDVFNRYQIDYRKEPINIEELKNSILKEKDSVLIILNTIDDSKDLFNTIEGSQIYNDDELYLLNSHFTPNHRKEKIHIIKERLKNNRKTILISTQLIEAGVDIDFPVLYRDFALISSIVQSAGRCNRNGRLGRMGKVVLFNLIKEGKSRANIIYGKGKDKDILTFTKQALGEKVSFQESELLGVQKIFFNRIANELQFAKHTQGKNSSKLEFDFLQDISECLFAKIGKFQLIDEDEYGHQFQYYVPKDKDDLNFENLLEMKNDAMFKILSQDKEWENVKILNFKIQSLLKKMANQIVSVRLKDKDHAPILAHHENYNGIYKIDMNSYSIEKGIKISGEEIFI